MNTTPETLVVGQQSIALRVEADSYLREQERYREFRGGNPDHCERLLSRALLVIRDLEQIATLSSKGRGEDLEAAAEAVHRARFTPGDESRITPFADEDRRGQEYCRRIARAVLALTHPTPEPCSPVAREGESLLARVVAEIEAEIPMPGNDRQMHGTYAQGVFAALQIARQALAQTPPALSGGGELRFIAAIIEQSPNGETVSVKYHPDGEWTVYDRDAGPMLAALAQSTPAVGEGYGYYVASRATVAARPAMWRALREQGVPINSTWIDEAGDGETACFTELWERIKGEIARSSALILYAEAGDFPLKGALTEAGIAIGMGKRVAVVTPGVDYEARSYRPIGSWVSHPLVTRFDTVAEALAALPLPVVPHGGGL